MLQIYRDVIEAQGILSLIDSKNRLLSMVRIEKKGIFYSPEFLNDFAFRGNVGDKELADYIETVDREVDRICGVAA